MHARIHVPGAQCSHSVSVHIAPMDFAAYQYTTWKYLSSLTWSWLMAFSLWSFVFIFSFSHFHMENGWMACVCVRVLSNGYTPDVCRATAAFAFKVTTILHVLNCKWINYYQFIGKSIYVKHTGLPEPSILASRYGQLGMHTHGSTLWHANAFLAFGIGPKMLKLLIR